MTILRNGIFFILIVHVVLRNFPFSVKAIDCSSQTCSECTFPPFNEFCHVEFVNNNQTGICVPGSYPPDSAGNITNQLQCVSELYVWSFTPGTCWNDIRSADLCSCSELQTANGITPAILAAIIVPTVTVTVLIATYLKYGSNICQYSSSALKSVTNLRSMRV